MHMLMFNCDKIIEWIIYIYNFFEGFLIEKFETPGQVANVENHLDNSFLIIIYIFNFSLPFPFSLFLSHLI